MGGQSDARIEQVDEPTEEDCFKTKRVRICGPLVNDDPAKKANGRPMT